MKNYYLILLLPVSIFAGFLVFAQEEMPAGVTFPIAELGNCKSKTECMTYCDLPENMLACLDFAEKHNLIPKDEVKIARKMLKLGATAGPGGCKGKVQCEAYCDDMAHIEECLAFAEKHNLIPAEELKEGKKVAAAMKKGIKPPNCRGKSSCDAYCSQPAHMEECLVFAEAAGLIPQDEIAEAKMALKAMKQGIKPPPCRGKQECDAYCGQEEHFAECLTFAEAAGFISPEEAIMAKKTGGKGPGNCRSKESCDKYCDDPAHSEECLNFAEKHGFISEEDAENARKMLKAGFTSGPGGCKSQDECEAYCNDLSHQAECMDFAIKAGFMSAEEAEMAKKMTQAGPTPGGCRGEEECRNYCQDPAHAKECIDFAVKIGEMSPETAEEARRGMEMMRRGGPGGCKSEGECMAYCDDPAHGEECFNFAVQQGLIEPEEAQFMREERELLQMETGPEEMPLEEFEEE